MALCQQREGKREGNEEETIGMERRAVAIRPEKGGKQMVPPFDCIWECRATKREKSANCKSLARALTFLLFGKCRCGGLHAG